MTRTTQAAAAGVALFLGFSLACELGEAAVTVWLANMDDEPVLITAGVDEYTVGAHQELEIQLTFVECSETSYTFTASRSVDGVPAQLASVTCVSDTLEEKGVAFNGTALVCADGWTVENCGDTGSAAAPPSRRSAGAPAAR